MDMLVMEDRQIFSYLGASETKDLNQLRCLDLVEIKLLLSNGTGAYHENCIHCAEEN